MIDFNQVDKVFVHVLVVEHTDDLHDSLDTVSVIGENQHVQTLVRHDHAAFCHEEPDRFNQIFNGNELYTHHIGG